MGFTYGPLGAWLPELFPAKVRYTGCSIAFNVGGILGGALTPIVAQVLASSYGLGWVGLYCSACGLLSLVVLMIARGKEAREV
jgi:MFS family permease